MSSGSVDDLDDRAIAQSSSIRSKSEVAITLSFQCSYFRWWSPSTNLLHEREKITHAPVIGYFAVLHAHDIDRLEVNFAMGWSDAEERSFMRPVVGLVGNHTISIGNLPVDLRMKVGKRHAKVGIELPDAGLVGSCARLRCVVNKILREEFLEEVEVPTALHFFGIAADDSFCVLG